MGEVLIAGTAALLICIFLSPKFIGFLQVNQFGQNIREEGPEGQGRAPAVVEGRLHEEGAEDGEEPAEPAQLIFIPDGKTKAMSVLSGKCQILGAKADPKAAHAHYQAGLAAEAANEHEQAFLGRDVDQVPPRVPARVLDAGCGTGYGTAALADRGADRRQGALTED